MSEERKEGFGSEVYAKEEEGKEESKDVDIQGQARGLD